MFKQIDKKIFTILQCELCGDVFKDRSKLQNHMTKHTGRYSHRPLCNKNIFFLFLDQNICCGCSKEPSE